MRKRPVFMAVACALLAAGCQHGLPVQIPGLTMGRTSDERQIAVVLEDAARGMETRRVSRIMAQVSPNYQDAEGRDYEAIREYLSRIVKGYRSIRITRTRPKIAVEGDSARAMETFGTIAEHTDPAREPVNLQGQVEVRLERVNNKWQIVEWGFLQ